MPETPKTVLILQLDEQQGKIWNATLHSQGVQVDWRPTTVDIVEMLTRDEFLPDLLIMDIGIKSPTSNSLQVVPVCNWCRALELPLKVLLLNSSSMQVKAYEQKWATGKCGAIGIIPRLSQATLNGTVALIMEALSNDLKIDALDEVINLIADIYTETLGREILKIRNEIATVPKEISPKVTTISSYRGAALEPKTPIDQINPIDDPSLAETRIQTPSESLTTPDNPPVPDIPKAKVTTYRGVKVKKLQW